MLIVNSVRVECEPKSYSLASVTGANKYLFFFHAGKLSSGGVFHNHFFFFKNVFQEYRQCVKHAKCVYHLKILLISKK